MQIQSNTQRNNMFMTRLPCFSWKTNAQWSRTDCKYRNCRNNMGKLAAVIRRASSSHHGYEFAHSTAKKMQATFSFTNRLCVISKVVTCCNQVFLLQTCVLGNSKGFPRVFHDKQHVLDSAAPGSSRRSPQESMNPVGLCCLF